MFKPRNITDSNERLYLYGQSTQISAQTGFIGHLRGDFGEGGNEFHTTWFPFCEKTYRRYYSTQRPVDIGTYPRPQGNEVLEIKNFDTRRYIEEIGREAWGYIDYKCTVSPVLLADFELCGEIWRTELGEVVNILRRNHMPLSGRVEMAKWVKENAESMFDGTCGSEYGLRVDSDLYTYLFRFIPRRGEYNFYCYVYTRRWFDDHLEKASKGVRFITPEYEEIFRVPDGAKIIITAPDGKTRKEVVRYIDGYHVEVGNNLFHICEFSERMVAAGNTCRPAE